MTGRRPRYLFAGVTACFVASFAAATSADPVRVRASQGGDFGKIVFSWPTPVGHRMTIPGDQVVVRFDRPIEASYPEASVC